MRRPRARNVRFVGSVSRPSLMVRCTKRVDSSDGTTSSTVPPGFVSFQSDFSIFSLIRLRGAVTTFRQTVTSPVGIVA